MSYQFVAFLQDDLFFKPFKGGGRLVDAFLHNLSEISSHISAVTLVGHPSTSGQVDEVVRHFTRIPSRVKIRNDVLRPASMDYPDFISNFVRENSGPCIFLDPGSTFLDPDMILAAIKVMGEGKLTALNCCAVRGWEVNVFSGDSRAVFELLDQSREPMKKSMYPMRILPGMYPQKCGGITTHYSLKIDGWNAQIQKTIHLTCGKFSWELYETLQEMTGEPLHALRPGRLFKLVSAMGPTLQTSPIQIEVELTTDSTVVPVYSPLHHKRDAIQRRGRAMDLATLEDVLEKIAGGIAPSAELIFNCMTGDPLEHPRLPEILDLLSDRLAPQSLSNIVICTYGRALDESAANRFMDFCRKMFDKKIYVQLIVRLDAANAGIYAGLKKGADFETAKNNVTRLLQKRKEDYLRTGQNAFLMAVATILLEETQDHMDEFMNSWPSQAAFQKKISRQERQALGTPEGQQRYEEALKQFYVTQLPVEHVVIYGPSHFAAQIPIRPVADYTPLKRAACRRLNATLTVLCDGTVVICDRVLEPRPETTVGRIHDFSSLREIWTSPILKKLRETHQKAAVPDHPLCSKCSDWYIPL